MISKKDSVNKLLIDYIQLDADSAFLALEFENSIGIPKMIKVLMLQLVILFVGALGDQHAKFVY